jgi:predicted ATPase
MLKSIKICNFKCFTDQHILLSHLTLFSGINGIGKSSVLQALLALRQSKLYGNLDDELQLNGELINLGTPDDIICESGNSSNIEFILQYGDSSEHYIFHNSEDKKCMLRFSPDEITIDEKKALFSSDFAYLQAERVGPRTSLPFPTPEQIKYNWIGCSGEFCAHHLLLHEADPITDDNLCLSRPGDEKPLRSLRSQVELWLSKLGRDTRITLQRHPRMDLVSLLFSFVNNGVPTPDYRPTHVGFGLSYALPIFTAVLLSRPGSLLLVENPEAHLHPKGQSLIGHFLALAASCGRQIIVETHSDHLLNGVRLAVKKQLLDPKQVAVNFFTRDEQDSVTKVLNPTIDKNGRITSWPDDFFDEWEKNLMELL